jgi:Zn-dependent protease with chaperone function
MATIALALLSGSIFFLALQARDPPLASMARPVAELFADLLFLAFVVVFVASLSMRVYRRLTRPKTPLDEKIKERVQRLGTEVSSKMGMKRPARFLVMRGFFAAGAVRGNRVLVGETLVQDSTDLELDGVIGHELAHILRKHLLIRFGMRGLTFVVLVVTFVLTEPARLWQIAFPFMIGLIVIAELPIYWKLEYDADANAAEHLGGEPILQALGRLKMMTFDGISFTHPPLSRRIRRIRHRFPSPTLWDK